ncbi:class I SAM-dependent methyltransferase [Methanobacterium sp.]|uniref:class I SAM-dependent methyltransferase n=1 Tax=Methanobacterium sp. TaxID=2164 RepID=UPI003C792362
MEKYDFIDSNPSGAHSKIIKIIGKDKKVLDVGCATGNIAKILSEKGCEVTGIEMDPKSAKIASKYCKNIIIKDLESLDNLNCPYNYFDVLLFADILEHLKSPVDTLRKLKKYLHNDGIIIITVPNVTYWEIRLSFLLGKFEYNDYGILDKTHIRFFTKSSALSLLKNAGFKLNLLDTTTKGFLKDDLGSKFEYSFTKILPGLFAYQFLLVGKAQL